MINFSIIQNSLFSRSRPYTKELSCEDESVSSTVTDYEEDSSLEETTLSNCSSSKKTKISVTFDETCNRSYNDTERSPEDCIDTWYSKRDYKRFKSETGKLIKCCMQMDAAFEENEYTFTNMLIEIYQGACDADLDLEDAVSQLDKQERSFLFRLYGAPYRQELIGLEFFIARAITKHARGRRARLQDAVAETQGRSRGSPKQLGRSPHPYHVFAAEELRESCSNITHGCNVFAQYLARAQQYAQEDDSDRYV
mmetsp:Transcript_29455/g.61590  ORF Transcript_29455/g.61590 Transcript_29455/m.61590 type:complete len:253 (-) Transcript_29455:26-784(-)